MNDLDKMARELLAAEYGKRGFPVAAEVVRSGDADASTAMATIRAALLTAPPGWKLVPLEPPQAMTHAGAVAKKAGCSTRGIWAHMLAAAPEVK